MSAFTPPPDACRVCPPSGYCDLQCVMDGRVPLHRQVIPAQGQE